MDKFEGRETQTYFVTKYWATRGILKVQGYVCSDVSSSMLSYREANGMNGGATAHGNDWWETEEDALVQAETLRLRKIVALEKQLTKLKSLGSPKIVEVR